MGHFKKLEFSTKFWIFEFSIFFLMLSYIWIVRSIFAPMLSHIWIVRSIFAPMLSYIWIVRSIFASMLMSRGVAGVVGGRGGSPSAGGRGGLGGKVNRSSAFATHLFFVEDFHWK